MDKLIETPVTVTHKDKVTNQVMVANIVLLILKRYVPEDVEILVDTFDNCREYGYTYSVKDAKQDMVFCVYEHRNSDCIIINGCLRKDMKKYGPYRDDKSKYSYYKSFMYSEYEDVAKTLLKYLIQAKDGHFVI